MSAANQYTFTQDQRALLSRSMELVSEREDEPIFVEFGKSQGFEAARLGFVGHEDHPLLALHSAPAPQGITFMLLELGPPPSPDPLSAASYQSFASAANVAAERMTSYIGEAKAPYRAPAPAFGEAERAMLGGLAEAIGQQSRQQSYADIQDIGAGAQACGIGVVVRGKKIVLATLVATRDRNGFECSVRDYQNNNLAGVPPRFLSVAQAIAAYEMYFIQTATIIRQKTIPWWQRLFA